MKFRTFLLLALLLFVAACNQQTVKDEHKEYLSDKGWGIKESTGVETYVLDIPDEMLSNFEASGITFLRKNLGEEVTEYSYLLKEKDMEGHHLKALVFELDGKTIGGYGILPSWAPGTFHLDEKERLKEEQMMKE